MSKTSIFFKVVSLFVMVSFSLMPITGYSLPQGANIVEGKAVIDVDGNNMDVNVSTDQLIADWQSFSIAQPEAVHFYQPSASSIALNRVVGVDPSSIFGTLTATGRLFLINPNGILFGATSHVDTNGLIASTLNISNADFLAGRYTFYGQGGSVVNQGYISSPGGFVSLLGSTVANTGTIEANLGTVSLASGEAITLGLDAQGLISVVVDQATTENLENKDSAVDNSGKISADGGCVILTAKALDGVFKRAINNTGILEANTLENKSGEIVLTANQRVNVAGIISAEGGTVTVDSEGADFSANINAASGTFNMNDGDTLVEGGIYGGGFTWNNNLNITVRGDVTGLNGSLVFNADSDSNNTGNFYQDFGLIKTVNFGDINISGENVTVRAIDAADNLSITANNYLTIAPAWSNKKTISINNSGSALSDYQIKFNVIGLGSYDDIRFVNSNGNPLSYWIENVSGTTATVWVKVDSIPENTSDIYMYHGNPLAVASESNGEAVFDFFDGFDSYAGWSGDTGNFEVVNLGGESVLKLKSDAVSYPGWIYKSLPTENSYVIECQLMDYLDSNNSPHPGFIISGTNGNNWEGVYFRANWDQVVGSTTIGGSNTFGSPVNGYAIAGGKWYTLSATVNGGKVE